jgi:hypothetical protein
MAQINCPHCSKRGYVRSSIQITEGIRELYLDCNNPKCLARDVMTISHKHTIQPPINSDVSPVAMVENMLRMLPANERKQVMSQASLL